MTIPIPKFEISKEKSMKISQETDKMLATPDTTAPEEEK